MSEGFRKFMLTAHVTSSIGWLGAVAAFLALEIAGLTSRDAQTLRAVCIAMKVITWFVIVPLSIASPLTGILQSLGTTWGLFRHYWVLMKFLMTIPATTILLLMHVQPIDRLANAARSAGASTPQLGKLLIPPALEAGIALLVLLVATVLSTYKPPGRTPFSGTVARA